MCHYIVESGKVLRGFPAFILGIKKVVYYGTLRANNIHNQT